MKFLLFLIALGAAGYVAWTRDWPSRPLRESGAQLEHRLNHTLSGAGISDGQIVAQVRRERTRWFVAHWVETDREIAVESLAARRHAGRRLSRTADDDGIYRRKRRTAWHDVLLDVSHFGLRFQRIQFFPRTAKASPDR